MATTAPTRDDTALVDTNATPGDVILAPLRDDTTNSQEASSVETPSTTRSRERRRRNARGSIYSRRSRRVSRGDDSSSPNATGARRNRKFASRLGRSRSSFVDRINHAVAELLNLEGAGVSDDDVSEGDKAAGAGATKTTSADRHRSSRRLRRARNPSATGGGTRRRKFGSLLGRSRTSFEEGMDHAVAQSIRQLRVENIHFEDDDEDDDTTKGSEGDRAAGTVEVGKNGENRISTATTIRVDEDSGEE